jgi:hypothetical protein
MDKRTLRIDKMRYQTNRSAYSLVLLSLVVSIIALFTLINYDDFGQGSAPTRVVPDLRIGLEIALGIIMMLVTFLGAEKVKFYDPLWSKIGLFVLAGINIFRMVNIPLYAFSKNWISATTKVVTMLEFGAAAGLLIAAGVISFWKVVRLHHHLKAMEPYGNDAV